MNQIKMVIADLDGTLLTRADYVPPENIKAFRLAKAAGILPVIATGRLEKESVFAAKALGATDYIIAMNGLMIYDYRKQKPIVDCHMPDHAAKEVLDRLDAEPVFYQLYAGNEAFATKHAVDCLMPDKMKASYYERYKHSDNVTGRMWDFIDQKDRRADKMFVCADSPKEIEKICRWVTEIHGLRALSSGRTWLEILPEGTDKKNAVQVLSDYVEIPLSQTMAIGDSENDVGMLSVSGFSVAMENGCELAKQTADVTAPSNEENGVAWAIHHFILQDE